MYGEDSPLKIDLAMDWCQVADNHCADYPVSIQSDQGVNCKAGGRTRGMPGARLSVSNRAGPTMPVRPRAALI